MTRLKYIIITTIGLLLTAISCSDGDEIVRNLGVEPDKLVFAKEAETKIVKIAVARGDNFTASWDGELWGSAVADVQNGEVSVTVNSNTNLSLRQASVVVSLDGGLRNQVIKITQNGSDPLLDVIPNEIIFDFLEEKQIIEVESNAYWTVSNDVEWLDVKAFTQTREIVIIAAENFEASKRTTTLTVTAGTSSKKVIVEQNSAPVFMIPYLAASGASIKVVEAFEQARHSTFIYGSSGGLPHIAVTKCPLIPEIRYTISGNRVAIVSTKVDTKQEPNFFGMDGNHGKGHDFLLESNFVYLFKSKDYYSKVPVEYYWLEMGESSNYDYLVSLNPTASILKYDLTLHMPDNPDYPTFDTFPYPSFIWGTAQAPIDAWEATNGGTLSDEGDVGVIHQVVYQAADPYHMRVYHYKDDELVYVMYLFNDYKKMGTKEYLGTFSTNEKFEELLLKEGFSATGAVRSYANQSKDLALTAGVAQIETDGPHYGVLEFRPYSTLEGIGSANKFNSMVKYLPSKQ